LSQLLAFIALVLAIVAVRSRKAVLERLTRLERELAELRRMVVPGERPAAEGTSRAEGAAPPAAERPAAPVSRPPAPSAATEAPRAPVPPTMPPRGAPPPPPPPRRERPPTPPSPPIDWERWLGVRGAAVLGGVALALASLFFFRYSIEHGLIPPWLRVAVGTAVGVGAILTSERVLRREYGGTADALAGAGVATLYAAFWAARTRYDLIGTQVAFLLLVLVTVTGAVLAWRHHSQVIALLGLAGGFATPLMIGSRADNPIGLFGYLLLLDIGLLQLAERRRWPLLGHLGLALTAFYQLAWIAFRMGPDRLLLGLVILGVFAAVFALAGRRTQEPREWRPVRAASVLLPFAFATYLAGRADLGPHLWSVAGLLFLLSSAAAWLARTERTPTIALAAAAADVGVVTVWMFSRGGGVDPWEAVAVACALAVPFHVSVERDREPAGAGGPAPAAIVTSFGFLVVLIFAALGAGPDPWPWLAGWGVLAALLVRHGGFPGRGALRIAAALGAGAGVSLLEIAYAGRPGFPEPSVRVPILLAIATAFQVVAVRVRANREHAEYAAAVAALVLLVPFLGRPLAIALSPTPFLGTTLLLGLLATLAATRLPSGRVLLAAVVATAVAQTAWTSRPHDASLAALGLELGAVVLFTAWPFLAPRLRDDAAAWWGAALAGPLWFLALRHLWEQRFGDAAIGLLPILLGAIVLGAALRARDLWPADAPMRRTALAWLGAVALGFTTVAIPLQLDKEWILVGWALEGLAVTALWRRLDHPGLKWFGLALLAVVTWRLLFPQFLLEWYPRPAWRIVNWLAYTYLVPAGALLGTAALLRDLEAARVRPWEQAVYPGGRPVGTLATALAGLVVIFVWINVAIADWFATGPVIRFAFERLPARDLTTSIAWALYALLLLGIGMARKNGALRWVSLALVVVTIFKVFLYDLGELRDLYRVASLLGLAVSLILISLAYQRFVFRKPRLEDAP
jgi:Predicted membrane protein (DUF2339)